MSDPLFAQRLTESLGPDVVSTAADAVVSLRYRFIALL